MLMADTPTQAQQDLIAMHSDTICAGISEGKSLRAICESNNIPRRSVFKWLEVDEDFMHQYTRARQEQADTIFDEILEIADESKADKGKDGVDHENIQRPRLRIDARKWMAGKMRPKKYGDHIRQEHTGPDGEPLQINPSDKLTEFMDVIAKRGGKIS